MAIIKGLANAVRSSGLRETARDVGLNGKEYRKMLKSLSEDIDEGEDGIKDTINGVYKFMTGDAEAMNKYRSYLQNFEGTSFYSHAQNILGTRSASPSKIAEKNNSLPSALRLSRPEVNVAPSDWLPPEYRTTPLERAQRNIDARSAFRDEEKLAEMDRLAEESAWKAKARAADKARRDAATPSNNMSHADLVNRDNDYRSTFNEGIGSELNRTNYENYGNRLVWKNSQDTAARTTKTTTKDTNAQKQAEYYEKRRAVEEEILNPKKESPRNAQEAAQETAKSQIDVFAAKAGNRFNEAAAKVRDMEGFGREHKQMIESRMNNMDNLIKQLRGAKDEEAFKSILKERSISTKGDIGENIGKYYEDELKSGPNIGDYFHAYHGPGIVAAGVVGASVLKMSQDRGRVPNSRLYSDPF